MKPTSDNHPTELLAEYADGSLDPERAALVEEHLRDCRACADAVDDARTLGAALREFKDALFCPESVELHRYVRSGDDPDGRIATHLETCARCNAELVEYAQTAEDATASSVARRAFEDLSRGRTAKSYEREGVFERLSGRLREVLGMRGLAFAAAVAVVLVAVVIVPRGEIETRLALSSVDWDEMGVRAPKGLISPPRVAVMVAYEGFDTPRSQEFTDSLYRNLFPPLGLLETYDFINPAAIREALPADLASSPYSDRVRRILRMNLKADLAIVSTLVFGEEGFTVHVRLYDLNKGTVIASKTVDGVGRAELPVKLRNAAYSLLSERSESRARRPRRAGFKSLRTWVDHGVLSMGSSAHARQVSPSASTLIRPLRAASQSATFNPDSSSGCSAVVPASSGPSPSHQARVQSSACLIIF